MITGALVLLGTLAAVCVLGLVLRSRHGRIRTSERPSADLPGAVRELLDQDAADVTLLQLSTLFCAPCRHTRALLGDLAERTRGLRHVELDLTDRPELAGALSVLRTPTTLAFDRNGTELLRVGGVPDRSALLAALRPHLPATG